MKTMKGIAAAAVILAGTIVIGAGTARADEKKAADRSQVVQVGGVTYRVGIDTDVSWEPRLPLETGALPVAGPNVVRGSASGTGPAMPTIEVSGRTYRVGLDWGP